MADVSKLIGAAAQRRKVLLNSASVPAMLAHGACLAKPAPEFGYGVEGVPPGAVVKAHAYAGDHKVVYETRSTT